MCSSALFSSDFNLLISYCIYIYKIIPWAPKILYIILFSRMYVYVCGTGPGSIASEGVQRFIEILQTSLVHDMANKLGLRVPMKINVKMGVRWGELQPVT